MYLNWAGQVKQALDYWGKYRVTGDFDEVVVIGMGGSGIVGDYLQLLSTLKKGIPVYTVKSHIAPSYIDENTLVILVSYSGNTIETIKALRQVLSSRAKPVVVSSGGVLREEALRNNLLYIPVPSGLLPRASLPAMLYSILGLLDSSGYTVITREEAEKSHRFLVETTSQANNIGVEIADWMARELGDGKLPVIATHSPLEALAIRSKNEFNENSKIIVKVDVAPEWMHNDIVGYEKPVPNGFLVLEIVDPGDSIGVKLVDFMEKIYRSYNASIYRLNLLGESILEKIMYGSLVAGLASVYLAERRGLDPAETKSIHVYKREAPSIFG